MERMEWKDASPESLSAGDVLVAGPGMTDGHFARSLVFLQDHGPEGSLGLILNRPLGQTLGQLMPGNAFPEPLHRLELHYGGPVQSDQMLLILFRVHGPTHRFHCEWNPGEKEIEEAGKDPHCVLKAFLGYAGWGEGQLVGEIARRDWFWTAPDEMMICGRAPLLWELMVAGDYRWQRVREQMPSDPGRN